MAIGKNNFKVSRLDSEFPPGSRSKENVLSAGDENLRRSPVESEDDDEFDDADSGMGSDDFELADLGEIGTEFCQVGDQTCCVPYELYDLSDLSEILSLDVWNECLTEEERFNLAQYLPDMDQETFMHTLKELFEGENFHFGSPIAKLFEMLKGGLCEPRVALYRRGLRYFQKHGHYHFLRNYQRSMVGNLLQIREAWQNCKGYSVEENVRVLNIMRNQKSLMNEKLDYVRTNYSDEESAEPLRVRKGKGRSFGQKAGHDTLYRMSPSLDFFSQGNISAMEPSTYGKQNPKGVLKLVGSKGPVHKNIVTSTHRHQSGHQGLKSASYGSALLPPQLSKLAMASGYDSHASARRTRDQMKCDDDIEGAAYGMDQHGGGNAPYASFTGQRGSSKSRKKQQVVKEYAGKGYVDAPASLSTDRSISGLNLNVNQLSDIKILTAKPSNARTSYDYGRKGKYFEPAYEDQMPLSSSSHGNHAEFLDGTEPYHSKRSKEEGNVPDTAFGYDDWDVRGRKKKLGKDMSAAKTFRTPQQEMDARLLHSQNRGKPLEKIRKIPAENGGPKVALLKANRIRSRSAETESDSSEQYDEEEDSNPLMMRKLEFPIHNVENFQSPETGSYPSKSRLKAKKQQVDHLQSKKSSKKIDKNSKMQAAVRGNSPLTSMKHLPTERKQKGAAGKDFSSSQSRYLQDYFAEEDGDLFEDGRLGDSAQTAEKKTKDHESALIGCSSAGKKRKQKVKSTGLDTEDNIDYRESLPHELGEFTPSKKRVKKKVEAEGVPLDLEMPPPVTETTALEPDLETKPQKTFTLITPTVHKEFKFSVVHLLSAVRMSMITPNPNVSLEAVKHVDSTDGAQKVIEDQSSKHQILDGSQDDLDVIKPGQSQQTNMLFLTIQEIVDFVRSNPGDPCILETQEPLQDLIRGVLKILLSKTAPLGAKGWKPLVGYEKSRKCWHWIGTVTQSSSDEQTLEPVTSPEAWGIPHKMLVKLVDSFANWLKSGLETLQQIGSLPAPPVELMQNNLDEKERFRDLRAQKSLITIIPSSEDVRAYFRKEEQLRYSIPDRAFSYTAADGKKSIVAPLRRCGGKPTSKARDHPMLKRDRPPHVTILCLVRDAASRLPGSIGTRADVCTLIKDSQYIVEDVADAQVNQVVSGALDRLHYERDPCVLFDGERKLWVYLHREREEEDFEDDGTSSTKKWKRPKKDATEQSDQAAVTVAYPGSGDQTGFDLSSDLNAEPSCADDGKTAEAMHEDARQNSVDNMESIQVQGSDPITWEIHGSAPVQDNKLQCQENSTNEDFVDETSAEERDVGLVGASL